MNTIDHQICLDLLKPGNPPVVHAVQGDCGSRAVQLSLFCNDTPWQIPDNTLISVRYGRVDLTGGYYDTLPDGTHACSHEGNIISIILAPQMMTTAGLVHVQVELLHDTQLLATFTFHLMVELNPANGITESETYVNWLQWMENQLQLHITELIENGAFTGPTGANGAPAEVTGSEVVYQASTSASVIPDSVWSNAIPDVQAGHFLWTRTTVIFNHTTPVTFYTVSRMGLDGLGSVATVCGISPDSNGNVPLTAADVGALPSIGGDLTGALRMNGQPISGLNAPTANDQAANMAFVNQQMKKAAPRNLLDNSDFRNPVNQRGQTVYSGNHYTIDRWRMNGGSLTVNSGISFTAGYVLFQPVEKTLADGVNRTFAIGTEDGVYCTIIQGGYSTVGNSGYSVAYDNGTAVYINRLTESAKSIDWVALYEGEYTPETLPVYQANGYRAELAECQRYLQRFRTADFRKTYCEDFRPTMRMTDTGVVSDFELTIDGIMYYFSSAEL